jgi:ribosomal protein S27E
VIIVVTAQAWHSAGHGQAQSAKWTFPSVKGQIDQADVETSRISTCPNCAAVIEFSDSSHATECPFCATPVVTDTGEHRRIKPKGLLPFAIDERRAKDAMTQWLGRLWFAPNGLKDYARKGRK